MCVERMKQCDDISVPDNFPAMSLISEPCAPELCDTGEAPAFCDCEGAAKSQADRTMHIIKSRCLTPDI
jgi:hypothetical protein